MNSWCDKLSQVSAWYPQGLLTTTGLVYWVLKTWSLFLSLRSPQRAPHTELALLTGLTFYVDSASLPPAVQARGLGTSSTPTSAAPLTSNHTPSPITPVSCKLWNPFTSATATYLIQVPINSYLDTAIAPNCPPSLSDHFPATQPGWLEDSVHSIMSHDITDFQGLVAALGMKAVPQHRMWPPCTSLASSLTLLQFPWNPGHPKNYFHFLKWAVTSALGFWTWSSPCREHSFPTSPHLSSSVKSQPGNHFFQESCFCHYHSSRHIHTPQSLPITPPTQLCHRTWLCPQTVCMLSEGRPHLHFAH